MNFDSKLLENESVRFSKTISEADFTLFSAISGDFSPIHVDEAYARGTAFGRRIAHGGLIMGLLSTTAAMMSQKSMDRGCEGVPVSLGYDRIRFLYPAFIGDTLTATYMIDHEDPENFRTYAKVEVKNQDNKLCLVGAHILKWVSTNN
jgi:3-hydroxybutyryl-CoA dehydratase